jgi:tRNA-specific 2-thiouridylase
MSRNGKIIVAMSGGVDSSVAACLLKEQGYECSGVFLRVGSHAAEPETACQTSIGSAQTGAQQPPRRRLKHGCCSATDAMDARAVAGRLGIPFYALNFEREFDRIIDYFVDEYAHARTPNPCVMCNIHVKFGRLLNYADLMDAPGIATGHYARIVRHEGRARLARSFNLAKDQSYVLFGVAAENLPRCRFPLGEIQDKAVVRSIAADLGLNVHDKPDSQEICFVPDNDYAQLVQDRRPEAVRPGEIRDRSGRVLGWHEGTIHYTIGQRRGLRLAMGRPVYVTDIDPRSGAVTIGERHDLAAGGLTADDVIWHGDPPTEWTHAHVKIRHMHEPAVGWIRAEADGKVRARFEQPQQAVTPGQAAVFYQNDMVHGGGWIRAAEPESEPRIGTDDHGRTQ